MKVYIKNSTQDIYSLLSIKQLGSIVYVEDPDMLENYNANKIMKPRQIAAAKKTNTDYSTWTREQLLKLKEDSYSKFDRITDDYVLLHILHHEDLTPNQLRYVESIKTVRRDVSVNEVKHVLKLIRDCSDVYRIPSIKNRQFYDYLLRFGIKMTQRDVLNILKNLHIKDFSQGRYSTDSNYWGHALMLFEFEDYDYTFECGKKLPESAAPLRIYIKINQDLSTNDSVAIVSFHEADKMPHPINYPVEKENPDTWK